MKISYKTKQKGFTLIELVTVIILLGILAVSITSKLSDTDSFEPYAYRAQLISALRLTQQRAMQQTHANRCHQLVFDNVLTRYGIPDKTDCSIVSFPNNWQSDATGFIINDNQISFSINGVNNPSVVSFDGMGRPGANCTGGCDIDITGVNETVQIRIESEGYVHAL